MYILVLCGSVVSCDNFLLNYLNGRVHWNCCKKSLHIKWCSGSPGSSLTCLICSTKCCVFLFRWCGDWLTRGWMIPANTCHPIDDEAPAGHFGSKGVANFMDFREPIKLRGNSICGVHLFVCWVTKSSCLFDVLEGVDVPGTGATIIMKGVGPFHCTLVCLTSAIIQETPLLYTHSPTTYYSGGHNYLLGMLFM